MKHLLCTKHYHSQIMDAKAGLAHLADDFVQNMFKAIYQNFGSSEVLNQHLAVCRKNFEHGARARKFMASLEKDQRRSCL